MSQKKPKTNKKDDPRNLVEYTYRDLGQEYLMRRKMWRAIVMAILMGIYAVELLVAAIQAYVFTLLSAVYIQLAEADEH